MNETAQILCMAADLVARPDGWTQGVRWRTSDGGTIQYCAIGAIEEAATRLGLGFGMPYKAGPWDAGAALARSLDLPLQSMLPNLRVAEWNDRIGRTQAEVVAALRKAAAEECHGATTR